jgi:methylenetetrahydrofolate reductase (NADPH)
MIQMRVSPPAAASATGRPAFHVELVPPGQNSPTLEDDLEKFCRKYLDVTRAGHTVAITDNAMGKLSFQGTEIIEYYKLPVPAGRVSVHLTTFHTPPAVDEIMRSCLALGIDHVLVISGDGSDRLPKLRPADVDAHDVEAVTSVQLLAHLRSRYGSAMRLGVAFNPYEPREHEMDKLRRKLDAGAGFIITQPIIERHEAIDAIRSLGVPVVVEAWMSKKLSLLSDCVGYTIPEDATYDPMANLRTLVANYPGCDFYLSMLGVKTQMPLLAAVAAGGAA